jgi:hypothetical protein
VCGALSRTELKIFVCHKELPFGHIRKLTDMDRTIPGNGQIVRSAVRDAGLFHLNFSRQHAAAAVGDEVYSLSLHPSVRERKVEFVLRVTSFPVEAKSRRSKLVLFRTRRKLL